MPSVCLLLLALAALAEPSQTAPDARRHSLTSVVVTASLACLDIALLTGLYLTAIRPVSETKLEMTAGDRSVEAGRLDAADAEYALASTADSFAEAPWRRRADLAYQRVVTDQFRSNELFQTAVRFLNESVKRDPFNFQQDRQLGEWWLGRWRRTNQMADARESAAAFKRAWNRYPTNALLMADLISALIAAEERTEATEVARKAIEQDDINRKWGHEDRILPKATRAKLEKLATES
jgi:hypothetical protein